MIGIELSCNPEKLKKTLAQCRVAMKGYYGLSKEDKEEVLVSVAYRFEVDAGKFSISTYVRHCKNKVIDIFQNRTAKKRRAQAVIDGKTVYFDDISLNLKVGEEEDMEYGDFIPKEDMSLREVEIIADIERKAPEFSPLVKKVLMGLKLEADEKQMLRKLRNVIKKEDLI